MYKAYGASGMNSSLHTSTYESVRVINSLITQKIQYVFCQVCIILGIDPEKPRYLLVATDKVVCRPRSALAEYLNDGPEDDVYY